MQKRKVLPVVGDSFFRVSGAIEMTRMPGRNVFCRDVISHRQGPAESAPAAICASGFKASLEVEGLGGAFRSAGSDERKGDVFDPRCWWIKRHRVSYRISMDMKGC